MSRQSPSRQSLLATLHHGLIVSCQAEFHEALYGAQHMAAMARAACQGGAAGIRANSPADIIAIRAVVHLPIIGIYKEDLPGFAVRITPTLRHARQVSEAGADLIAIDATDRPHPDRLALAELIQAIHSETGRLVVADISTRDEGLAAEAAGADLVATTLSGYTEASRRNPLPDFALIRQLSPRLSVPLIAEGRIARPEQAVEALRCGAFAVVVGSAITRPGWITARFVEGIKAL